MEEQNQEKIIAIARGFFMEEQNREKIIDIVILVIIVVLGLFTGILTFGILKDSTASLQNPAYSLGGALAGVVASWLVLGVMYRQFRQSSDGFRQLKESNQELQKALQRSDEIKELRKQNEELQQKLLRYAPRPKDYKIEILEREAIVLAWPSKWLPGQRIIFNFQLPASMMQKDDVFPAEFMVSYIEIESKGSADDYYRDFEKRYSDDYRGGYIGEYTGEYIDLGGELGGIRSLKVIALECYRIVVSGDPKTNLPVYEKLQVTLQEYIDATKPPTPSEITTEPIESKLDSVVGTPKDTATTESTAVANAAITKTDETANTAPIPYYDQIRHMVVVCYHEAVGKIYFFDFWDDIYDFTTMSAEFNQILRSTRFLT